MILKYFNKITLVVLFIIFLIDRITKEYVIFLSNQNFSSEIFSSSFFNIILIWNDGIAFGLLSFEDNTIYNLITIFISLIVIVLLFLISKSEKFKKYSYMIITGGENIFPIEIENVISLHPDVNEVVIVGLKDEKWGQKVTAFIKSNKKINFNELDDFCKKSDLSNFKRPKSYVFIKEIPKSPTGKILRRKILAGEYELDN